MRRLKTRLVYGIVGFFALGIGCVSSAGTVEIEVISQLQPVEISFVGVSTYADEPLTLRSSAGGVDIDERSIRISALARGPVEILVGRPQQSEIEQTLRIACPYCRIKLHNFPVPTGVSLSVHGKSLWVRAHQLKQLDLQAHAITLLEASAVESLTLDAHAIDARGALIAAKSVSVQSESTCVFSGALFESLSQASLSCEDITLSPDKLQTDMLSLKAKRASLHLQKANISSLQASVDTVFMWLSEGVHIAKWAGHIQSAQVFTAGDMPSFKADTSYQRGTFAFLNNTVNKTVNDTQKRGEGTEIELAQALSAPVLPPSGVVSGTASSLQDEKIINPSGGLRVKGGFLLKTHQSRHTSRVKVSEPQADKTSDGDEEYRQSHPASPDVP